MVLSTRSVPPDHGTGGFGATYAQTITSQGSLPTLGDEDQNLATSEVGPFAVRRGVKGVEKREQTTPGVASKAMTGLGRAVLANVIGKAIWSLLVSLFQADGA